MNSVSGDGLSSDGLSGGGSGPNAGPEALGGGFLPGTPAGHIGDGHLGLCDYGLQAIEEARNPAISFVQMTQIRARLSCPGCVGAFDLEVKLKSTLAATAFEAPPAALEQRITSALGSIDLSQLDITDF